MINWWEPGTQKNYLEKSNCFIDQYGNYTFDIDGETVHLNGVNTLGENIADNGGLKQALRAYDQVVARDGPEPLLPGTLRDSCSGSPVPVHSAEFGDHQH